MPHPPGVTQTVSSSPPLCLIGIFISIASPDTVPGRIRKSNPAFNDGAPPARTSTIDADTAGSEYDPPRLEVVFGDRASRDSLERE